MKKKIANFFRQEYLIAPKISKYDGYIVGDILEVAQRGDGVIYGNKDENLVYAHFYGNKSGEIPSGLVCHGNGGLEVFDGNHSLGRIYLNLEPTEALEGFQFIAEQLQRTQTPFQVKVFYMSDSFDLNRTDKCVVYFSDANEVLVLNAIEKLPLKYLDFTGIPKFASPLKDSNGKIIRGVSFGQEPYSEKTSFNIIRSNLLTDLYLSFPNGFSEIQEHEIWQKFEELCAKYQIDPNWPAFNINSDGKFQRIRTRCAKESIEDFTKPKDVRLKLTGSSPGVKETIIKHEPPSRRNLLKIGFGIGAVGAAVATYEYFGKKDEKGSSKKLLPKDPVVKKRPRFLRKKKSK